MSAPGWLEIAGGKIELTYRLMAEQAVDQIAKVFENGLVKPWRDCSANRSSNRSEARYSTIVPPQVNASAVKHFCEHEWAQHLTDVMLRRAELAALRCPDRHGRRRAGDAFDGGDVELGCSRGLKRELVAYQSATIGCVARAALLLAAREHSARSHGQPTAVGLPVPHSYNACLNISASVSAEEFGRGCSACCWIFAPVATISGMSSFGSCRRCLSRKS